MLRLRLLAWSGVRSGVQHGTSGVTCGAQRAQTGVRCGAQVQLQVQAEALAAGWLAARTPAPTSPRPAEGRPRLSNLVVALNDLNVGFSSPRWLPTRVRLRGLTQPRSSNA